MKDKSDLPKLTIADFKASDLQAFPSDRLDPVFFQELRAYFASAGYRSVLNESERQEQEVYFARNWVRVYICSFSQFQDTSGGEGDRLEERRGCQGLLQSSNGFISFLPARYF